MGHFNQIDTTPNAMQYAPLLVHYTDQEMVNMAHALDQLEQLNIKGHKELSHAFSDYLLLRDILRKLQGQAQNQPHQAKQSKPKPKNPTNASID